MITSTNLGYAYVLYVGADLAKIPEGTKILIIWGPTKALAEFRAFGRADGLAEQIFYYDLYIGRAPGIILEDARGIPGLCCQACHDKRAVGSGHRNVQCLKCGRRRTPNPQKRGGDRRSKAYRDRHQEKIG